MDTFKEYLPDNSVAYIQEILVKYDIEIKIKSERKTRHGDFRVLSNGNCLITINSNLNKYRFLITLIHEIAHLYVYKLFKNSINTKVILNRDITIKGLIRAVTLIK